MSVATLHPGPAAAVLRVRGLSFADRNPPSSGPYCCICLKPLKPGKPYRLVYMTNNACAVHADDVPRLPAASEAFLGISSDGQQRRELLKTSYPIGTDCARRIGLEWSVPTPSALPPEHAP